MEFYYRLLLGKIETVISDGNLYDSSIWHRPMNKWNHTYMMVKVRVERKNKVNVEFLNESPNGTEETVDNFMKTI